MFPKPPKTVKCQHYIYNNQLKENCNLNIIYIHWKAVSIKRAHFKTDNQASTVDKETCTAVAVGVLHLLLFSDNPLLSCQCDIIKR